MKGRATESIPASGRLFAKRTLNNSLASITATSKASPVAQKTISTAKKPSKSQSLKQNQPTLSNSSTYRPPSTFKPTVRPAHKLHMHSTLNLTINQQPRPSPQQLLDSLLYGESSLQVSAGFDLKQQQSQELLIDGCDNFTGFVGVTGFTGCGNFTGFRCYGSLSPIRSEKSEGSVGEECTGLRVGRNAEGRVVVEGVVMGLGVKTVLQRRLLVNFCQKSDSIVELFLAVNGSASLDEFATRLRTFLFKNGIIFNKAELTSFMGTVEHILEQIDSSCKLSTNSIGHVIEKLFLLIPDQHSLTLQLNQQTLGLLLKQSQSATLWEALANLSTAASWYKQPQPTIYSSRFSYSHSSETSITKQAGLPQIQQIKTKISQYLCRFLIATEQNPRTSCYSTNANASQAIKIRISPARLH